MSMTEKEINVLYRYWDSNPNIVKEALGLEIKRPWYMRLATKIKRLLTK